MLGPLGGNFTIDIGQRLAVLLEASAAVLVDFRSREVLSRRPEVRRAPTRWSTWSSKTAGTSHTSKPHRLRGTCGIWRPEACALVANLGGAEMRSRRRHMTRSG